MNPRKIVVGLLLATFSTPAFAGDLKSSMRRAAVEAAQTAPRQAPAENPYKVGALALMIGGAAIAVYGFTHTNGAEISSNTTGTSVGVKETKSTGIGFVGLGVAGLGAVMYGMGEKKKAHPEVSFGRHFAAVGARVRW